MKKIIIGFLFLFLAYFAFTTISTTVTKNIDSYIYQLPYQKGTNHKVVQGYGGLFSHKNIAAIDFSMPIGSLYMLLEKVLFMVIKMIATKVAFYLNTKTKQTTLL
ncbi:MAG: hypothetical protein KA319_04635 [Ferruginibacter sp.]|nr:hypothetical protein [Ferruginibacter sp.]